MTTLSSRSHFLTGSAAIAGSLLLPPSPAFAAGPMMDVVNARPYDWGTPLAGLDGHLLTPNRTFFIRSHMGPPDQIEPATWRLDVAGLVRKPLRLSLAELRKMPRHDVTAVLQCSGNGRFLFGEAYPDVSHPAGAQWKYGAVGNARWTGVRVRDVLERAGIDSRARFATNIGLDNPILPATPKFIRGIELAKLMDPDSIFAYEMNGEPLPYFHGHPVRLVVPGWAADHWVKWFTGMTLTERITDAFWTSVAYRYPNAIGKPGAGVAPALEHPVTGLNVKSIITSPLENATATVGQRLTIRGFAWSGDGASAKTVEVSADGGTTWHDAALGSSAGPYAWKPFETSVTPVESGVVTVMARATDTRGAVQPMISPWNPSGYLWNGIHRVDVRVA